MVTVFGELIWETLRCDDIAVLVYSKVYWYSFISKNVKLVFNGQPWCDEVLLFWYGIRYRSEMVNVGLGPVLNPVMHVSVSISDWYQFSACIFVQIRVIAVWYMFNVWYLVLFFISCFSCAVCVLLYAQCICKENHNNSNASVVFSGRGELVGSLQHFH